MTRATTVLSTLLAVFALSAPAQASSVGPAVQAAAAVAAQDDLDDEELEEAEAAAEADANAPSSVDARAATPGGSEIGDSLGGATGFVFPRGFYVSSDLGVFFRLGTGYKGASGLGEGDRSVVRTYSNAQPFIGLSFGYDLTDHFGVQASLGSGYVSGAAHVGAPQGFSADAGLDVPTDYSLNFMNIGVTGTYFFFDRLAVEGRVFGGAVLTSPKLITIEEVGLATWNAGGAIGLRYATLLTDVVVGVDVAAYVVGTTIPSSIGGDPVIPAMSISPVVKYVF